MNEKTEKLINKNSLAAKMGFTSVFSEKFQVNGLARTTGQVGDSIATLNADGTAKFRRLSKRSAAFWRTPSGARLSFTLSSAFAMRSRW